MTPDINVLIAASRSDHVHHKRALAWLAETLETGEANLQILPMVAAGFLRLVTHPKVFVQPTPMKDALRFIERLLVLPNVDIPELGREWPILRQLCSEKAITGNGVSDAWIASAVRLTGNHLVTFDRGFRHLLSKSELTILS